MDLFEDYKRRCRRAGIDVTALVRVQWEMDRLVKKRAVQRWTRSATPLERARAHNRRLLGAPHPSAEGT